MTRLASIAEAGYFPFPPSLFQHLAAQVAPSKNPGGALVDMFAGQGECAAHLGRAWNLRAVGVELHEERARAARRVLDRAICCDAFQVIGSHDQFDLCYANPPYQYDRGDPRFKRLEYRATLHVTPYIRHGGLLVAVLPEYQVAALPQFVRLFATQHRVERVFRLPEPEFSAHRQIVIYARRLAEPRFDGEAAGRLLEILRTGAPPLPPSCDDPLPLPDKPVGRKMYFRGRELEPGLMLEEIVEFNWSGAREFARLYNPRPRAAAGRPLLPFRRRHLGQMITAAALDNAVLQNDGEINIICGRSRKRVDDLGPTQASEDDEDAGRLKQENFDLECAAFNPATGEFKVFKNDLPALAEYVRAWRAPLVESVMRAYPPRYNFDFRETFEPWAVEYIDRQLAKRMTIPGRSKNGAFEGQRHVLGACHAALTGMNGEAPLSCVYVCAPTGFGKTVIAAGEIGLLLRQWAYDNNHPFTAPGWPICFVATEPSLVDQLADEINAADPLLRTRVVSNVDEADDFINETRTAPWPMVMVVARTTLKDGFGWRHAAVPHRHGYFVEAPNGSRRVQVETIYTCPDCGALQREEVKGVDDPDLWPLARDESYFAEDRRRCIRCAAPLWQHYRQIGGGSYRVEFWECATHWDDDRDRERRVDARVTQINEIVCRSRALSGKREDFRLERGDEVFAQGDCLVARRDGRAIAAYDLSKQDLAPIQSSVDAAPGARIWRVPGDRQASLRPPMARLPVAEYLLRIKKHGRVVRARGGARREQVQFLAGVLDELHTYRGGSTNAGYALGNLACVADKTIGLTATIYNGYASSLFHVEYRTNPRFRAQWSFGSARDFVRRYGLFEWIERGKSDCEDGDDIVGHSRLSGYSRRRASLRELPAISPELTVWMLDHTIFVGMADLGWQMVPRREHPALTSPEEDFARAYEAFLADIRSAVRDAGRQGVNLGGSIKEAMLSYVAAPWRETCVKGSDGKVWAWAPDLEIVCAHCGQTMFKDRHCAQCHAKRIPKDCQQNGCGVKRQRVFAKERALIERLLAAKQRGRKALVCVHHTDTLDIVESRWIGPGGLCAAHGIRAVSAANWGARKRSKKLAAAALEGVDAVFTNPQRTATGMNLIQYPEIHHFQLDFSLITVTQVNGRPWRPTQTVDVDIYYYVASGTYEVRAAARMGLKQFAALTLYGDDPSSALLQASGATGGDLLQDILTDVAAADVPDLADIFARVNQAAGDIMRPEEFIGGAAITVEQRGPLDVLELQLEAALLAEAPASHRQTQPVEQMALF
jgi:hypothetical protein